MNNKEKFLRLVSDEDTNTLGHIEERIANRDSRRMAFDIALKILDRLDQLGWSQKRFAEELGVSPQLVNKWVRGKENFTIETLVKIGKTLNMSLIEVPPSIVEKGIRSAPFYSKPHKNRSQNETVYSLKKKLNFNTPNTYSSSIHFDTLNIAAEPTPSYASKVNIGIAPGAINYLLSSVSVDHLNADQTPKADEKEFSVNIKIGYLLHKEQHAISCSLNYEMVAGENPLLTFKVTCVYTIEPSDWDTLVKNSHVTISSSFANHLGVVTSGIVVGILHEKLEHSIYRNYPMTLIHADDLPNEDITFKLN